MCMGTGKTRLSLRVAIAKEYKNILIAVPKNANKDSWRNEIQNYRPEMLKYIYFTTYRSLPKQEVNYDFLILDEFHRITEKHLEYLKKYTGDILGLTGTPPVDTNSIKYKIMQKYYPICFKYSIIDAVNDGVINNYKIIVHKINLSEKQTLKKKGKYGAYYTSESKDYASLTNKLNNAYGLEKRKIAIIRMSAMKKYNSKELYASRLFISQEDKTICFANTTEQADKLCEHSYHSKNKNSNKNLQDFKDGKIKKLSCVNQLSEGVNIPNLKVGIILHSYSSNVQSAQRIARMFRLNPNKIAKIHILCYKNTIDEEWVNKALTNFDQSKISYVN